MAKEDGKLEAYSEALAEITDFLNESSDVERALESPVFPPEAKQSIVEELIKAGGFDEVLSNFLRLLVERGRVQHLRSIVDSFGELMDEEMGVVKAVVTTAVPLPGDLKEKMAGLLAEATGKKVTLKVEENPAIIGGMVARVGDMVWDGSIRSQLQKIKDSIGRSELR